MDLNEFRQVVVDQIKAWMPELKSCKPHRGRFQPGDLKDLVVKPPAILVAALAISKIEDPGTEEVDATVQVAAFVITGDVPALKADVAALNICNVLTTRIPGFRFGKPGIGPAEGFRGANMYSGKLARKNVDVWGLTWKQTVRLGTSVWVNDPDAVIPTEVYLGIDPDVGDGHEGDYEDVTDE